MRLPNQSRADPEDGALTGATGVTVLVVFTGIVVFIGLVVFVVVVALAGLVVLVVVVVVVVVVVFVLLISSKYLNYKSINQLKLKQGDNKINLN